jgi:hypothetical protein
MTPSLERLEEMVRLAEARTRARKLEGETRAAADALRSAEKQLREILAQLKEHRPELERAIKEAESDELRLRELVKKVSQLIGSSAIALEQRDLFLKEIEASRAEIEQRRRSSQSQLEALQIAASEARRQLESTMEDYLALRREMDRLQPALAAMFQADDQAARNAEELFLSGQIRALAREVETNAPHFGTLDRRQQLAQLMVWIGRLKRLQAADLSEISAEDQESLKRIFPRIVGLSKHYEPGYIEAFRQNYTTDWDAYIARAEEQLRIANERARQDREEELRRKEQESREQDRMDQDREDTDAALDVLRAVIAHHDLDSPEGAELLQQAVLKVVAAGGAADPTLLQLVSPYRDYLTGSEFRAVRKHLDRIRQEDASEEPEAKAEFADILAVTRGRRALMIGGSAREESRRSLQRLFEFEELDWENHEDQRPAQLDSIENRIRNQGVDLVLILRDFVGHAVSERLRPASEDSDIPCLLVEHGYGPTRVAEAIRKSLRRAGGNGKAQDPS